MLPWLWCRPAAVAPIRPLAWEHPYAVGAALKKKKKVPKQIQQHIKMILFYAHFITIRQQLTQQTNIN